DGRAIAIADGMGVPIEYWEPGDIIVQNHSFATSIAGDLPPYIQVGAYWLDTMERWHLSTNNDAVGDRILIAIESR
ncbi:MAG: hypothetical protein JXC32_19960, partial [Anaerolineae bacterium]|nr:hypothetical protein [Anaerolineae bacterium]